MFTTYRIPPMLGTGTTVRPLTWVSTAIQRLLKRFNPLRRASRGYAPSA